MFQSLVEYQSRFCYICPVLLVPVSRIELLSGCINSACHLQKNKQKQNFQGIPKREQPLKAERLNSSR